MTLDEFNKRICEPLAETFLKSKGMTREEYIAYCEEQLEPHRRVMKWVEEQVK